MILSPPGQRRTWKRAALALVALAALLSCRAAPPPDRLTVLLASDILTVDPNQEVEAATDSVLVNVFEPLVGLDEGLRPRTLLAESWEHPAPDRWRFRLRRNARFHDGTPVDAAAVRDGLLALKGSADHEAADFLNQVRGIEVVGPDTLDFITDGPRAMLAQLPFLYIVKANAPGAFPPLLGTGPYELKEWKRGERVRLERSAGYWGPAPAVREATFVPVGDEHARVERLGRGEADVTYRYPLDLLERPPAGVRVERRPGLTVFYLSLNVRPRPGNPLADVRVRRALHLGIDRRALLRDVLGGTGAIPTQPVAPLVFGHDPTLPAPRFDPQEARRLLADAGYAQGFHVRMHFPHARRAAAEHLRKQLAALGVELELVEMDSGAAYDLASSGGTELFLAGWDCSTGEASEFYAFCLHTRTSEQGAGNFGGYSSAELDRIAETNTSLLDQRKRRAELERAARLVMDELPVIPLYVEDDVIGIREGVHLRARADSGIRIADVTFEAR